MDKKTIYILGILITIFFAGFFSGSIFSKNEINKQTHQFNKKIAFLQQKIKQTKYLNTKIKYSFRTLSNKDSVLQLKALQIQDKESEIADLIQNLTVIKHPDALKKLKLKLQNKQNELNKLKEEYVKLSKERNKTYSDLKKINLTLKERNKKIKEFNEKIKNGTKKELENNKKQVAKMQQTLSYYNLAAASENKADELKGVFKKDEKDSLYLRAYQFYEKAKSRYDMVRIYQKISSDAIKKQINQE